MNSYRDFWSIRGHLQPFFDAPGDGADVPVAGMPEQDENSGNVGTLPGPGPLFGFDQGPAGRPTPSRPPSRPSTGLVLGLSGLEGFNSAAELNQASASFLASPGIPTTRSGLSVGELLNPEPTAPGPGQSFLFPNRAPQLHPTNSASLATSNIFRVPELLTIRSRQPSSAMSSSNTGRGSRAGNARASSSRSAPISSSPAPPATPGGTSKRKREEDEEDDKPAITGDKLDGIEVVDLVDKDEVPAELVAEQEAGKNYVRLSTLDCVICMDSAKDLTVTHCGHLFCSECLHSALEMDPARRICPICRQRIDRMGNSGRWTQRQKGFYPLELKLKTRPARPNEEQQQQQ
ncbi:hypothetical protein VTJ49DRAFT_2773 [Mycothermus thermophilus]|uniref:RING-type E3 ubiquitin transferase n=1 Tax=Humicola insolens TaxID=85995 RepID=A0ABR3V952_HUMIN